MEGTHLTCHVHEDWTQELGRAIGLLVRHWLHVEVWQGVDVLSAISIFTVANLRLSCHVSSILQRVAILPAISIFYYYLLGTFVVAFFSFTEVTCQQRMNITYLLVTHDIECKASHEDWNASHIGHVLDSRRKGGDERKRCAGYLCSVK